MDGWQLRAALLAVMAQGNVAEARSCIDKYGPCGNYGFMGMLMFEGPTQFFRAFGALNGEAIAYGTNYYV